MIESCGYQRSLKSPSLQDCLTQNVTIGLVPTFTWSFPQSIPSNLAISHILWPPLQLRLHLLSHLHTVPSNIILAGTPTLLHFPVSQWLFQNYCASLHDPVLNRVSSPPPKLHKPGHFSIGMLVFQTPIWIVLLQSTRVFLAQMSKSFHMTPSP